jgi:2-C-methyl-D-erythritol 4-phosphate cytidylyltransferase
MRKVWAIVVAAGSGRRFGSAKQFALLRGRTVVEHSLEALAGHPRVYRIVLVLPVGVAGAPYRKRWPKVAAVVRGGEKRQDSVRRGFARVRSGPADLVLIHDAVRPLVSRAVISRVIAEAGRSGAAVAAVPIEDTIKEEAAGVVVRTLDRDKLRRVQTPQAFSRDVLGRALRKARRDRFYGTDEASLVERAGHPVALVMGDRRNLKITTAADLKIAEALLED